LTSAGRPRTAWIFVGLFLGAMLFQLIVIQRRLGVYDESLELYCAAHVLKGQVPYRDFWTMYGPAQFYVLAAFFKVLGISVWVGRLYDALVRAGLACVCFALTNRLANRRYAACVFAIVLVWISCIDNPVYTFPVFPALLCSLWSVLFLYRYLNDSLSVRPLFLAGLLVGITATFRHDSGFYICFAEIVALALLQRDLKREGLSKKQPPPPEFLHMVAIYASGILIVALPVLLLLLWKVPLHDLFYDLFYVPGKIYPKVRDLPFPRLRTLPQLLHPLRSDDRFGAEQLIVYLPILVCLTCAAYVLSKRQSKAPLFDKVAQRFLFTVLLLLDALLFIKGLVRVSDIQMMQSIMLAVVLLAVLMCRIRSLNLFVSLPVLGCALYLVACSLPVLYEGVSNARSNLRAVLHPELSDSFHHTCHPPSGLERTKCMVVEQDRAETIQYVEQRTSPADRIYVGAGRHDKLLWSDVSFYFVSDRSSVTKWYDLHPGVQTTLPIQHEMVDSLERYAPKFVVLDSAADRKMEPNQSQYSSGVMALDDYIRAHYAPEASFGTLTVLARR
jgi:hypothetical protein